MSKALNKGDTKSSPKIHAVNAPAMYTLTANGCSRSVKVLSRQRRLREAEWAKRKSRKTTAEVLQKSVREPNTNPKARLSVVKQSSRQVVQINKRTSWNGDLLSLLSEKIAVVTMRL
uniref:Uncharacterized protein n=1 Tax=Cuerna arida TaxID=1464854 RepID=A0A1B6GJ32_9HEMI